MGRGMRWSPQKNAKRGIYSSVPSFNPPSSLSPGIIELSSVNKIEHEDEYEVYAVHASFKSTIQRAAGAVITLLILSLLITVRFVHHSHKSETISEYDGGFPSKALFGNGYADDFRDSTANQPPYNARKDFQNRWTHTPPYWEDIENIIQRNLSNQDTSDFISNLSSWGPCYPNTLITQLNWSEYVLSETSYRQNNYKIKYPKKNYNGMDSNPQTSFYFGNKDLTINPQLSGLCRPGFLIIGQAKCGTSSLYHYLIGHPRVLPALEKQLDYFKYLSVRPIQWYLSHFPAIETFLGRGALMTGESSPSYFPYPDVPHLIHERARVNNVDGSSSNGAYPKIIALVREPISRSLSAYEYNYVNPALEMLFGQSSTSLHNLYKNIPKGRSEGYYRENHLFSFEELARAELTVLKECLKPGGLAERQSREKYGPPNGLFSEAYLKQEASLDSSILPLVNADEFCYGGRVNRTVPLSQWSDLIQQYPQKVILGLDYHLIRAIIGRSIYALFLNWWYARFSKSDVYIVCTEDLHFRPLETMLNVSLFLGLPDFDFSNVTGEGMYNVGFNKGYDTLTSWDIIQGKSTDDSNAGNNRSENIGYNIEVSEGLQKELLDFFKPYNDALFQLSEKRCQWSPVR